MLEGALLFLVFAGLAIYQAAPSVTTGDAGEFAAAAATWGVPHAPGYPAWTILAKALGTVLACGDWAYRANLLSALCAALHAQGILASAAAPPTVLLDPEGGASRPYQEVQGTPIEGLAWDHVSFMLYTSILEGWSRGVLRRDDARALLGVACRAAAKRLGERAGASIGAVGVGAFGNEPTYRGVSELVDDVAVARAAGIDNLALFDLGGVIRRGPPEPWLDAFVETPPLARLPEPSWRLRGVLAGARLAGGVFGALGRLRGARPGRS